MADVQSNPAPVSLAHSGKRSPWEYARSILPGFALCLLVSVVALVLEHFEAQVAGRAWLEALVLAILLGTVVRSFWTPSEKCRAGIAFSAQTFLEGAVLLIGPSLSVAPILKLFRIYVFEYLFPKNIKAGVPLLPAHVVRWFPAHEALHARLVAGSLGVVDRARFTRQVQAPPEGSWFHDVERSGGVVLDLMLHDLDQALWHFGPVRDVTATAHGPAGQAVRAVLAHDSGTTSTVEATWGPAGTPFATTFEVTGSRGTARHDSMADPAGGDAAGGGEDPFLRQARELLDTVLTGAPARVTAADGVAAVALAERVLQALGT